MKHTLWIVVVTVGFTGCAAHTGISEEAAQPIQQRHMQLYKILHSNTSYTDDRECVGNPGRHTHRPHQAKCLRYRAAMLQQLVLDQQAHVRKERKTVRGACRDILQDYINILDVVAAAAEYDHAVATALERGVQPHKLLHTHADGVGVAKNTIYRWMHHGKFSGGLEHCIPN